jgi:hypothetical protein
MGALLGQEAPQLGRVNLDQRADPSRAQEVKAGAHVALIRRARKVRETALDAAVDQEVRQGVEHRGCPFGRPPSSGASYPVQSPEKLEGKALIAPNGAYLAGQYWRALSDLATKKEGETKVLYYVAAGEFYDGDMPNASAGTGGKYFHEHIKGLEGKTPYRWAWHAYTDGTHAGERRHGGGRGKNWWHKFKNFQSRMDKEMKAKHSKYPEPKIWLTEQGVVLAKGGRATSAWGTGLARKILKAYVAESKYWLTEQLGPAGIPQINTFFYYSTLGNRTSTAAWWKPKFCPKR